MSGIADEIGPPLAFLPTHDMWRCHAGRVRPVVAASSWRGVTSFRDRLQYFLPSVLELRHTWRMHAQSPGSGRRKAHAAAPLLSRTPLRVSCGRSWFFFALFIESLLSGIVPGMASGREGELDGPRITLASFSGEFRRRNRKPIGFFLRAGVAHGKMTNGGVSVHSPKAESFGFV